MILFCGTEKRWLPNWIPYKTPFKAKPVENGFFKSYLYIKASGIVKRFLKFKAGKKDPFAHWEEKRIKGLSDLYKELAAMRKKTQIPIVAVIMGINPRDIPVSRKIKELAISYGLPVVNTVPAYKNLRKADFCFHKLDCHPNEKAHKITAQTILSSLNELGYLL